MPWFVYPDGRQLLLKMRVVSSGARQEVLSAGYTIPVMMADGLFMKWLVALALDRQTPDALTAQPIIAARVERPDGAGSAGLGPPLPSLHAASFSEPPQKSGTGPPPPVLMPPRRAIVAPAMLALLVLFACLEPGANNVAPEVRITSPDNESEFRDGEPITVRADLEDDDGPNSLTIFWEVSPEPDTPGNPLTGNDDASLYFQDGLAIGEYDIKVTAVDVYNLQADDTIHLNIDENNPPSVRIDNPIEDEVYDLGDPIVVEVLVKPKDDEMGQIELEWGGIAEGNEEAPSRPPDTGLVIFYVQGVEKGTHELSVKAFDSSGAADTETVSFRVR